MTFNLVSDCNPSDLVLVADGFELEGRQILLDGDRGVLGQGRAGPRRLAPGHPGQCRQLRECERLQADLELRPEADSGDYDAIRADGKLDDYEVIKLFDGGSKKFEEKLNKAVPGVGEFHLEVFSLPWILDALQHLKELPLPGKIECERPERKPCCGGTLHRCFACEPPREFAGKKHLVRHMANKKHRKL